MMTTTPVGFDDPINKLLLSVSEDRIQGFNPDPFSQIARQAGLDLPTVLDRIRAMLAAGTIRRVRQTLMANNLAPGCLVAWQVSEDRLQEAFDFLFQRDPFSGHVVIRSTDAPSAGGIYRLWTTLKVPQGFSLEKHCGHLAGRIGASSFRLMPAKKLFALGVGHVRRRDLAIGSKSDSLAEVHDTALLPMSDLDWRVLTALKPECSLDEIRQDLWPRRARAAGVPLDEFCQTAQSLAARGVIGRFSTFLEHVKPLQGGERTTRFNALFHWAVPEGRQLDAGRQVGRFDIITHAYWREAGEEFNHVNIMAVAHGQQKETLLLHKRAIDQHLAEQGIEVSYTNTFWGGRSEIKPSEILPQEYLRWCELNAINPQHMRA